MTSPVLEFGKRISLTETDLQAIKTSLEVLGVEDIRADDLPYSVGKRYQATVNNTLAAIQYMKEHQIVERTKRFFDETEQLDSLTLELQPKPFQLYASREIKLVEGHPRTGRYEFKVCIPDYDSVGEAAVEFFINANKS